MTTKKTAKKSTKRNRRAELLEQVLAALGNMTSRELILLVEDALARAHSKRRDLQLERMRLSAFPHECDVAQQDALGEVDRDLARAEHPLEALEALANLLQLDRDAKGSALALGKSIARAVRPRRSPSPRGGA